MIKSSKLILVVLILLSHFVISAQSEPITTKVYSPTIKSVLMFSSVADYAFPIISLNAQEKLNLSFDDLKPTNENFCYTLILCNSAWVPVALQPNEYLQGNSFEQIFNFTFALATYQKFVHYSLSFPTENMTVKYAGNYIIKVYRNFNTEDVVLTQRCYILNTKTNISSRVHQATNIDARYTNQEVDIEVDASSATIPSPYTDAKLTILQNGRFDIAVTKLTPKYINGNLYNYDYEDGNLFFGGNEFRAFDIRNIRSVGINVSNKTIDTAIHINLKADDARGSFTHLALPDYNGKCLIANSTASDPNQLDYAYVTFTLNSISSSHDEELYVLGGFNNWVPSDEYKMVYNESRKIYQCTVLLKQGYYNYGYYDFKSGQLENSVTEGNHYETENDYYIFFYQKNYTYNFDELIGFQKANTGTVERR